MAGENTPSTLKKFAKPALGIGILLAIAVTAYVVWGQKVKLPNEEASAFTERSEPEFAKVGVLWRCRGDGTCEAFRGLRGGYRYKSDCERACSLTPAFKNVAMLSEGYVQCNAHWADAKEPQVCIANRAKGTKDPLFPLAPLDSAIGFNLRAATRKEHGDGYLYPPFDVDRYTDDQQAAYKGGYTNLQAILKNGEDSSWMLPCSRDSNPVTVMETATTRVTACMPNKDGGRFVKIALNPAVTIKFDSQRGDMGLCQIPSIDAPIPESGLWIGHPDENCCGGRHYPGHPEYPRTTHPVVWGQNALISPFWPPEKNTQNGILYFAPTKGYQRMPYCMEFTAPAEFGSFRYQVMPMVWATKRGPINRIYTDVRGCGSNWLWLAGDVFVAADGSVTASGRVGGIVAELVQNPDNNNRGMKLRLVKNNTHSPDSVVLPMIKQWEEAGMPPIPDLMD